MLSSIETYQNQSYVHCVVQPEVIKALGNELEAIENALKEINIIIAPSELELKLNQFALCIQEIKLEVVIGLLAEKEEKRDFIVASKNIKNSVRDAIDFEVKGYSNYLDAKDYYVENNQWVQVKGPVRERLLLAYSDLLNRKIDEEDFQIDNFDMLSLKKSIGRKIETIVNLCFKIQKDREGIAMKSEQDSMRQTNLYEIGDQLLTYNKFLKVNKENGKLYFDDNFNQEKIICPFKPEFIKQKELNERMLKFLIRTNQLLNVEISFPHYFWKQEEETISNQIKVISEFAKFQEGLPEKLLNIDFYNVAVNSDRFNKVILPLMHSELNELHLSDCKGVNGDTLRIIKAQCIKLQTLSISKCDRLFVVEQNSSIPFMNNVIGEKLDFPSLKSFSIIDCKRLQYVRVKIASDLFILSIQNCGCLQSVELSAPWGKVNIYPWLSKEGKELSTFWESRRHSEIPFFEESNAQGLLFPRSGDYKYRGCVVSNSELQQAEENLIKWRKHRIVTM